MWSVAAECTLRCYSKVRARRKHRCASGRTSGIKALAISLQPLQGAIEGSRGRKDSGLSPLKPPAQAAAASAAVGADPLANTQRQRAAASERSSRRAAATQRAQASVRCKNSVATNRKQSWDCITSAGAPRGAFGITSRARATLGITAARAPPHAGRWESLDTHAGTSASVSRITAMCRVRNNRIICQSSDPLEGMAITLNQWILLTARAIQSDAVAPNARRGTRLPPPQVSDARIAR